MSRKTPQPPPSSHSTSPSVSSLIEPSLGFPIVGIGASAGGLEALEQFFEGVPAASGMAFVVIQHLDPTRKGLMPELLQRATAMSVVQVEDQTQVCPNCVYVIPPNKDLSILHGVLHLFEPAATRGLRLPIDFFLRSLALDQQQDSIGVILSGMGSDGTLGLREIKEKAGLTLVQEPTTAKFDSMPRSAINSGQADIVAAATELPARILAYRKHPRISAQVEIEADSKTQSGLEKALILLRERTGHDFSAYKKNSLYRRIERRLGIHQIGEIASYVRYLQENPQELDLLFKELLIGVTTFFRDRAAWESLSEVSLPELLRDRPSGPFRAWVAGCSTGEEAYSLAIALREVAERLEPRQIFKAQIFATDLDSDAIEKARSGVFLENIAADVTPARLNRFFVKEDNGYRVCPEIREMVVFSPHSLIKDPPFTKLDLLSCRNLLIYLNPEIQKKLFPVFHYSLRAGGILFIGSSESIGTHASLFETIDSKSRIFRRSESSVRPDPINFPTTFALPSPSGENESGSSSQEQRSLQSLAEQLILQRFSPATVLVDILGNILHISGRTGKYLEPAAGKANWNIFPMAREALRYELTSAFQKALRESGPVKVSRLKIQDAPDPHYVDISVEKLAGTETLKGLVIVVFSDAAAPEAPNPSRRKPKGNGAVQLKAEYERDLKRARAELQNAREEMQLSQEDLRSTNEELQSTNEEMQSTNEELTTSKEEMQSLYEELQTVNAELQAKVDELSRSSNDLKNLLNSTDVATLVLDNELKVRRFSTPATKIINLIPTDVGRPITDLSSDLLYPELPDDAASALERLSTSERSVSTRDGRWFSARAMPYRTLDHRIDGVVITFWEISAAKELEEKLRAMQATLENRLAAQSTEATTVPRTRRKKAASAKRSKPSP